MIEEENCIHTEDYVVLFRYYQKQLLEDQLKERREKLHENRKKEEKERLTALGYTGGEDRENKLDSH